MDPVERPADAFGTLHLEHSSTVDRVAEELRRAVFEGELESGTPLREVALAESLGVSRPTLREALALLVAEGLATREPNRGVSVASPDPESVARRVPRPGRARDGRRPALADAPRRPTARPYAAPWPTTSARSPTARRTRSSTSATSPSTSAWSG